MKKILRNFSNFRSNNSRNLFSICLIFLGLHICVGQQQSISTKEKNAALDTISKVLTNYYVIPEKGKNIADYLQQQKRKKVYGKLGTYSEFLKKVNNDIQSIHKDLHLEIVYNPEKVQLIEKLDNAEPDSSYYTQRIDGQAYNNYGINVVKRLPGNIAYIKIREFANVTAESKKTIDAAFTLNPSPNAFIIDLRDHWGGDMEMGSYISNYFFKDSIHLSYVENRITNSTTHYWTDPEEAKKHFVDTPLYVLTSGNTFSAGEDFAYSLKAQNRAEIVGDTTAGGAHGTGSKVISNSLLISIPYHRIVNAVTNDNWEGVGVIPDVPIKSSLAQEQAHLMALGHVDEINLGAEAKQEVRWEKERLKILFRTHKFEGGTD